MKGKNLKLLIVASCIVVVIGVLLIVGQVLKPVETVEKEVEQVPTILYEIVYVEDYIPGMNHSIYFYSDKKIKLVSKPGCSTTECATGEEYPESTTSYVEFSEDGLELVYDWVKELNDSKEDKLYFYDSDLEGKNKNYLNAIVSGNESLLIEENEDGYKLIKFVDYKITNGILIVSKNHELKYEIKNKVVYINGYETDIKNDFDEFYVLDIDSDGTKEVITRSVSSMISPPTNNYHIYKYFEENEMFEEALTISIDGSIDSFYVNGCDIKVEYNPFESPEDYREIKHYSFISEDYDLKITPIYLNSPSNSVNVYKNNILVTKSFSTIGYKDLIYYAGSHEYDLEELKRKILAEASLEHGDSTFYLVRIKGDENVYYLSNESLVINEIGNILKDVGNVWYVK